MGFRQPRAPSSGRTSFGGKSPLTGGIKEANSGGLSSQKIAKLGLAAIILEGMPQNGKWYEIFVNKDGVKFEDATDLLGKGMYEIDTLMWEKYPKNPPSSGLVPSAKENLQRRHLGQRPGKRTRTLRRPWRLWGQSWAHAGVKGHPS